MFRAPVHDTRHVHNLGWRGWGFVSVKETQSVAAVGSQSAPRDLGGGRRDEQGGEQTGQEERAWVVDILSNCRVW